MRSATSTGPLFTSATMLHASEARCEVHLITYEIGTALCFNINLLSRYGPLRKASSCFEHNSFVEFGRSKDQATFTRNASLGSALSTITALKENKPSPLLSLLTLFVRVNKV